MQNKITHQNSYLTMIDNPCYHYKNCLANHGGREAALSCDTCKMKLIIKKEDKK